MTPRIRAAVVLGAGTMGAQLACVLADAGAAVELLDLDQATASRGLERALKLRPAPLRDPDRAAAIAPGSFERLESAVPRADWVIEAVVEQQQPKRQLLERVDRALLELDASAAGPLVTSNTSGLSIGELAEGRSDRFRSAFLGAHFFNPPRYARLLELIPIPDTDPDRIAWLEDFASRRLGKGTVLAKDRPAFIANRLGVHGMLTALSLAEELGLCVDEVDELTGPLIGRPKSAIFRTLDLVGLDVALAVADHCHEALVDDPERDRFQAPTILRRLVEQGQLGEKTGAGFYRRVDGEILALDLATGEYRPRRRVQSGAVELARLEPDLRRRLVALADAARANPDDPAACLLWRLVTSSLGYAAAVGPEIADDAASVDRAMRWGFGWELGPFELHAILGDRVGVPAVPETFRSAPEPRPGILDPVARRGVTPELPANASGTVVDLGDGILGVELQSRLNLIGIDTLDLLRRAVDIVITRFDGLVVGTQAADFSAGANLALLLMEAEEGEWDELDRAVRLFQGVATRMRAAPVPVVVAPRGRTLGGGAELCLAAARCQPLAETYLGLVETAVGLIPAGGGTTAIARRVSERVPAGVHADAFAFFRQALEAIALARVSGSAEEARALGYLTSADLVTADPDRQWADAVATARHLADVGYRPPAERPIQVLGRRGVAAAEALSYNQLLARQMSEHDRKVVLELARVMSGGDVAEGTRVSAGYLLDLEREAFLRLLGEPLTRARIRHTLKTGKPLRN